MIYLQKVEKKEDIDPYRDDIVNIFKNPKKVGDTSQHIYGMVKGVDNVANIPDLLVDDNYPFDSFCIILNDNGVEKFVGVVSGSLQYGSMVSGIMCQVNIYELIPKYRKKAKELFSHIASTILLNFTMPNNMIMN